MNLIGPYSPGHCLELGPRKLQETNGKKDTEAETGTEVRQDRDGDRGEGQRRKQNERESRRLGVVAQS